MPQHILIIEDEAPIRTMLADVLTDEGYTVATAASVDDGLVMLATTRPHIILCDLMIPRKNGREFYQRLTSDPTSASVPIIFMTALSPIDADARLIGDLQHVPVLYKPISLPELLTVITMFIASPDD